jgi:outer membrane receptor protein involved in Fe transport
MVDHIPSSTTRGYFSGRASRLALPVALSPVALSVIGLVCAQDAARAADTPSAAPDAPIMAAPNTPVPTVVVKNPKQASPTQVPVQSAPSSTSAISAQDLQDRGATDLNKLVSTSSNVSLKNEGNPGQTEIEMRGMSAVGGNLPTTGAYLDGVMLTPPANAQNGKVVFTPSLYDLNGVDVERGPQGTAGGAGSMGGSVNLMTTPPDPTGYHVSLQSTLSGTEGGGFNYAHNVMGNVPLGNGKATLRVVLSQDSESGWIKRIVANPFPQTTDNGATRGDVQAAPVVASYPGSNSSQTYGAHVSLLLTPTDNLTIEPSFFYQTVHSRGISAYDQFPGTETRYQPFDIAEPANDKIALYKLNATYTGDNFKVTSTTAYFNRRSSQLEDGSENFNNPQTGVTVAGANGLPIPDYYGPNGTGVVYGIENDSTSQISQEIRLQSINKDTDRFSWVSGVYASDYWSRWNFQGNTLNPSVYADLGTGGPATTTRWFWANSPTQLLSTAAYGEGTYKITDRLKLTAGLRVYDYDSSFSSTISGWGTAFGAAAPAYTGVVHLNSWGVNPKLTLSYDITPDLMVYSTVARGARPGGGNNFYPVTGPYWSAVFAPYNFASTWPPTYKPDHVWSYEAGEKATFFNNRAMLNTAVFFEDWENITLEALPGDWPLQINGKHAYIYGTEIDSRLNLGAGLQVKASGGYTGYVLDAGPHWQLPSELPDVAHLTGDVQLSYTHALSDKLLFTAMIDTSYVSPRASISFNYGFVTNGTYNKLPGYELTNLRAGIQSEDGWTLALFCNNVFNTHAQLDNLLQETLPSAAFNRIITNQPLTAGLDLTYKF